MSICSSIFLHSTGEALHDSQFKISLIYLMVQRFDWLIPVQKLNEAGQTLVLEMIIFRITRVTSYRFKRNSETFICFLSGSSCLICVLHFSPHFEH